jgi:hypothetical protein
MGSSPPKSSQNDQLSNNENIGIGHGKSGTQRSYLDLCDRTRSISVEKQGTVRRIVDQSMTSSRG